MSQAAGMDEIDTDFGSNESEDDAPVAKKAKRSG